MLAEFKHLAGRHNQKRHAGDFYRSDLASEEAKYVPGHYVNKLSGKVAAGAIKQILETWAAKTPRNDLLFRDVLEIYTEGYHGFGPGYPEIELLDSEMPTSYRIRGATDISPDKKMIELRLALTPTLSVIIEDLSDGKKIRITDVKSTSSINANSRALKNFLTQLEDRAALLDIPYVQIGLNRYDSYTAGMAKIVRPISVFADLGYRLYATAKEVETLVLTSRETYLDSYRRDLEKVVGDDSEELKVRLEAAGLSSTEEDKDLLAKKAAELADYPKLSDLINLTDGRGRRFVFPYEGTEAYRIFKFGYFKEISKLKKKHLAGRHDQKKHARDTRAEVDDAYKGDIASTIFSELAGRHGYQIATKNVKRDNLGRMTGMTMTIRPESDDLEVGPIYLDFSLHSPSMQITLAGKDSKDWHKNHLEGFLDELPFVTIAASKAIGLDDDYCFVLIKNKSSLRIPLSFLANRGYELTVNSAGMSFLDRLTSHQEEASDLGEDIEKVRSASLRLIDKIGGPEKDFRIDSLLEAGKIEGSTQNLAASILRREQASLTFILQSYIPKDKAVPYTKHLAGRHDQLRHATKITKEQRLFNRVFNKVAARTSDPDEYVQNWMWSLNKSGWTYEEMEQAIDLLDSKDNPGAPTVSISGVSPINMDGDLMPYALKMDVILPDINATFTAYFRSAASARELEKISKTYPTPLDMKSIVLASFSGLSGKNEKEFLDYFRTFLDRVEKTGKGVHILGRSDNTPIRGSSSPIPIGILAKLGFGVLVTETLQSLDKLAETRRKDEVEKLRREMEGIRGTGLSIEEENQPVVRDGDVSTTVIGRHIYYPLDFLLSYRLGIHRTRLLGEDTKKLVDSQGAYRLPAGFVGKHLAGRHDQKRHAGDKARQDRLISLFNRHSILVSSDGVDEALEYLDSVKDADYFEKLLEGIDGGENMGLDVGPTGSGFSLTVSSGLSFEKNSISFSHEGSTWSVVIDTKTSNLKDDEKVKARKLFSRLLKNLVELEKELPEDSRSVIDIMPPFEFPLSEMLTEDWQLISEATWAVPLVSERESFLDVLVRKNMSEASTDDEASDLLDLKEFLTEYPVRNLGSILASRASIPGERMIDLPSGAKYELFKILKSIPRDEIRIFFRRALAKNTAEQKHLAGRHDQKRHAGDARSKIVDEGDDPEPQPGEHWNDYYSRVVAHRYKKYVADYVGKGDFASYHDFADQEIIRELSNFCSGIGCDAAGFMRSLGKTLQKMKGGKIWLEKPPEGTFRESYVDIVSSYFRFRLEHLNVVAATEFRKRPADEESENSKEVFSALLSMLKNEEAGGSMAKYSTMVLLPPFEVPLSDLAEDNWYVRSSGQHVSPLSLSYSLENFVERRLERDAFVDLDKVEEARVYVQNFQNRLGIGRLIPLKEYLDAAPKNNPYVFAALKNYNSSVGHSKNSLKLEDTIYLLHKRSTD